MKWNTYPPVILLFIHLIFSTGSAGQTIDSTSTDQVDSLLNSAQEFFQQNDYDQSLDLTRLAKKIAVEQLGKESLAYGTCCLREGTILYRIRNFEEAEKRLMDSKNVFSSMLSEQPELYAQSLYQLALFYKATSQMQKAEEYHLEALQIREKNQGKEDPDYAASLVGLGQLYSDLHQFEKAETYFLEAKPIYEKEYGLDAYPMGKLLLDIGVLYWQKGEYGKALHFLNDARELLEKIQHLHPLAYAGALGNLGILSWHTGDFISSENFLMECISRVESSVGKTHPMYAQNLGNLAGLYADLGQLEKAVSYFLKTLDIFPKESPYFVFSLNNLSGVYRTMGNFDEAEKKLLEAIEIAEKVFGKENPITKGMLFNLGQLYQETGQLEKAETLYIQAKEDWEKNAPKKHPDYAKFLGSLGGLYLNTEQFEKAETLLFNTMEILDETVGIDHPLVLPTFQGLAKLYELTGQYEKAAQYHERIAQANIQLIEKAMLHLSEKELNNYINTFSANQAQTLSFTQLSGNKTLAETCYNNSLFFKGFLLQSLSVLKKISLTDEKAAKTFQLLKSYQRRLASQYSLPFSEQDSTLIVRLEEKATSLEKELARNLAGWNENHRKVHWQDIQTVLRPGEAAIEFVHFRLPGKVGSDSTIYAALVLRSDLPQPVYVRLFEERAINDLIFVKNNRKADYVNQLYNIPERGAQSLDGTPISLFHLILDPLQDLLDGVHTIYHSPSGLLHRINLAAIPVNEEEVTADRYHFICLNSTRQLAMAPRRNGNPDRATLFGGIQYEMDSTSIAMVTSPLDVSKTSTRGEIAFGYANASYRTGQWKFLPWTEKEVSKIAELLHKGHFSVERKTGSAATESTFKSMGTHHLSPRFLHLATHGYFFPDPDSPPDANRPVFQVSDHPMIRSGLILAGGNHAWTHGTPFQAGMEDGILTAYEISQLDLSGTELVVLSACETGLGEILGNEGVYGLQRAFKIAGAQFIIMSLWQVPDKETAYFMELFYRNLLEKEHSIPEAFRATQEELRQNPFVTPFQWAGFVLVE